MLESAGPPRRKNCGGRELFYAAAVYLYRIPSKQKADRLLEGVLYDETNPVCSDAQRRAAVRSVRPRPGCGARCAPD